ncbi:hypothetical protein OQA88_8193 [Cercophora sp. LCS_1]
MDQDSKKKASFPMDAFDPDFDLADFTLTQLLTLANWDVERQGQQPVATTTLERELHGSKFNLPDMRLSAVEDLYQLFTHIAHGMKMTCQGADFKAFCEEKAKEIEAKNVTGDGAGAQVSENSGEDRRTSLGGETAVGDSKDAAVKTPKVDTEVPEPATVRVQYYSVYNQDPFRNPLANDMFLANMRIVACELAKHHYGAPEELGTQNLTNTFWENVHLGTSLNMFHLNRALADLFGYYIGLGWTVNPEEPQVIPEWPGSGSDGANDGTGAQEKQEQEKPEQDGLFEL